MSTLRTVAGDGRLVGAYTRGQIREALQEYAGTYGEDFPQGAFSPSQAKRNGRPELVERYYKGRADGSRWPSLNAIKSHYPSWNAARADAGFKPNTTVPKGGRRPAGSARPILEVRERVIYLPTEKQKELQARVSRLEERLSAALDRARRAEGLVEDQRVRARRAESVVAEMRVRRGESRAVPKPAKTVMKTKTVTKTVKVKDDRALERARARLADADAARRAIEDQLKSTERDRFRLSREVETLRSEAAESAREAREAVRAGSRSADRLTAAEARVERLTAEVERERERAMGVSEAAAASMLVRAAEDRVAVADARAARAEREMAEQAAALTGELRKLTPAELAELRARGPAGPQVLAKALKKLAVARSRGGHGPLRQALSEVARAAVMWRDRIG